MAEARNGLCEEGDVFVAPLPVHGYVVGLVARNPERSATGAILVYVFRKVFGDRPSGVDAVDRALFDDVALIALTNKLGFKLGGWGVLGKAPGWDRRRWPVPAFKFQPLRQHPPVGRRVYDDESLELLRTENAPADELQGLHVDGYHGPGVVAELAARALGQA